MVDAEHMALLEQQIGELEAVSRDDGHCFLIWGHPHNRKSTAYLFSNLIQACNIVENEAGRNRLVKKADALHILRDVEDQISKEQEMERRRELGGRLSPLLRKQSLGDQS